jgi:hypothetical protein
MLNPIYSPASDRYENGMRYRRSGRSGVLLPEVSLGLWHNFGDVNPLSHSLAMAHYAFDHGITHFDLANNYGPSYGSAEETFGFIMKKSFKPYRDELFVSTKAGYDMWPGPYGNWGSRKSLMASLDQSLVRMGLDYVDVFYSHRYDPETPLDKYNVQFWQTETCIMSNDEEIGGGGGYDRTMKTALYVARIIHHDIVYAGARSWQWWRAVGGDYKDGLLREFSNREGTNGRVVDSKLLWALGNYSRFVRPSATRMGITATDKTGRAVTEGDTDRTGLMCTAYRNADGSWVMVVVNYATEAKNMTFHVDDRKVKSWQPYLTAEGTGKNLQPVDKVGNGKQTVIPARSIVTFVSR